MANEGNILILNTPRHFENFQSLHEYASKRFNQKGYLSFKEILIKASQTSDGTDTELRAIDGIAITDWDTTEVTLVGAFSANSNDYDAAVVTATYIDKDGDSHTATCASDNDDSTTEVAFIGSDGSTPVTDCYAITALSSTVALAAGQTFGCGATGALTMGVIQAEATAAVEADLHGAGDIYGRSHTDHADGDAKVQYFEYSTYWGEVKYGIVTHTATSSDEIRAFEGTLASTGLVTATTTTVKDFYRMRRHWTATAPTANSHEFLLGTSDLTVDGSGNDVASVILEGNYQAVFTRWFCRKGWDTFIGVMDITATQAAAGDTYNILNTYKPDGLPINYIDKHVIGARIHIEKPELLEEQTDIKFQISDNAGAGVISLDAVILEAERNE